MSSLQWLDYSEHDRRKALDVIDLFREKDTRDELGLGAIRDTFADLLFPGTSTIQTRARYFLFIPWIYKSLEEKRVSSAHIRARARQLEIQLIDALAESDDPGGTIGIDARASLKRLPSSVYWAGLAAWGIRSFPGSQDQYHRSMDRFYRLSSRAVQQDDADGHEGGTYNWHSSLLSAPEGFPKIASFEFTRHEAQYVKERIMTRARGTMLAFAVDRGRPHDRVEFPWEYPQLGELPERLREHVFHAQCFSEAVHGASLLYNLMLAEIRAHDGWTEDYRAALEDWATNLTGRATDFPRWNRDRFWEIVRDAGRGAANASAVERVTAATRARVSPQTRDFVTRWLRLALDSGNPREVVDSTKARELIRMRERALKRGKARLENRRSLELWGGAAGTAQIDYRWYGVQTIVSDILRSLGR